eukprot:15344405-Ditylum_brightwellii.AAC.1
MGTPSMENLKDLIRMNLIRNNKEISEDTNLYTRAFGPDVGALRGKTTGQKPTFITNNFIEKT